MDAFHWVSLNRGILPQIQSWFTIGILIVFLTNTGHIQIRIMTGSLQANIPNFQNQFNPNITIIDTTDHRCP